MDLTTIRSLLPDIAMLISLVVLMTIVAQTLAQRMRREEEMLFQFWLSEAPQNARAGVRLAALRKQARDQVILSRLRAQARLNQRSIEEEHRAILERALRSSACSVFSALWKRGAGNFPR